MERWGAEHGAHLPAGGQPGLPSAAKARARAPGWGGWGGGWGARGARLPFFGAASKEGDPEFCVGEKKTTPKRVPSQKGDARSQQPPFGWLGPLRALRVSFFFRGRMAGSSAKSGAQKGDDSALSTSEPNLCLLGVFLKIRDSPLDDLFFSQEKQKEHLGMFSFGTCEVGLKGNKRNTKRGAHVLSQLPIWSLTGVTFACILESRRVQGCNLTHFPCGVVLARSREPTHFDLYTAMNVMRSSLESGWTYNLSGL